jgi:hypothetical protein
MTQIWERLFLGRLRDAEELVEANPHGAWMHLRWLPQH